MRQGTGRWPPLAGVRVHTQLGGFVFICSKRYVALLHGPSVRTDQFHTHPFLRATRVSYPGNTSLTPCFNVKSALAFAPAPLQSSCCNCFFSLKPFELFYPVLHVIYWSNRPKTKSVVACSHSWPPYTGDSVITQATKPGRVPAHLWKQQLRGLCNFYSAPWHALTTKKLDRGHRSTRLFHGTAAALSVYLSYTQSDRVRIIRATGFVAEGRSSRRYWCCCVCTTMLSCNIMSIAETALCPHGSHLGVCSCIPGSIPPLTCWGLLSFAAPALLVHKRKYLLCDPG